MNNLITVIIWAIAPAILAWALARFYPADFTVSKRRAKLLAGMLFGCVGVICDVALVNGDAGLGNFQLGLRDSFEIIAAFWFGPVAGICSTAIITLERMLSCFWSDTNSVWIHNAIASALSGIFAAGIAKYLFGNRRPAIVPAVIISAVAEIIHLAALFLIGSRTCPMLLDLILDSGMKAIACGLFAPLFASILCRSWQGWRSNFASAASGVAIFYVLALVGTIGTGLNSAKHKTEALLDYAEADLRTTIDETVDSMLLFAGNSIINRLGSAKPHSNEEMIKLGNDYSIDELNIVDREGHVIGSNYPGVLGSFMPANPETAGKFMILTNGVTKVYSQPFRVGADNPDITCKYLGVAFPDGNGYIQLGYDEQRLARVFGSAFKGLLSKWQIGETGYYLCAEKAGARVVFPVPGHPDAMGKSLLDIGMNLFDIPKSDGGITFVQNIFGERCFCRHFIYGLHRMYSIVPAAEFYSSAMQHVFAAVAILFVVFAVFGYAIGLVVSQSKRIAEMRAMEDQRRERDLAMAKTIQLSVLPAVFPPFPNERRMDIFARMDAAKEVGGDFYDIFRTDADHLVVTMADVSGKGVPAAMFMMRAKTFLKSCISASHDLAGAIAEANSRLAEGNEAMMFVTCWVAKIDLRTGEMQYVNAGHNPPYVLHANQKLEKLDEVSGIPLASFGGMRYKLNVTTMLPGDKLVIYTDGVTEATNNASELLGEPRLEKTISANGNANAEELCAAIKRGVDQFAKGAPQADDITVMAVTYFGPKA